MNKGFDYTGISIVYFCHDGQGNFLMQKRGNNCRDERGRWDIGAGGLDFGDAVDYTLRKEIKEEYSTDILKQEFLGFRDVHRIHEEKKTHWVTLDFRVLVNKDKAANGEPHKFDEIGWFRLDAMPSPVHSQLLHFLSKYAGQL